MLNLCVRCGKERKVVRTWTETTETKLTTYSQSLCPDEECQSKVDELNAARLAKQLLHSKPKNPWQTNKKNKLKK